MAARAVPIYRALLKSGCLLQSTTARPPLKTCSLLHTSASSGCKISSLEKCLDPKQETLLQEPCILVDAKDKNIGSASKRDCHLIGSNNSPCPLHRAFSVFLFNNNNELLLQQRSGYKITFPGYYTNSCCSHPLHTETEVVEEGALGVIHAAKRRLGLELGIPSEQISPSDFTYITRIHYDSPSGGPWGEHEIDYILFLRGDFTILPNSNEVKEVKSIKREELQSFIEELNNNNIPITPWFKLIIQKFLPVWWKNIDNLDKYIDHETIHYMR